MENSERYLSRINYKGDLADLMPQICTDYNLGDYQTYQIIPIGYEDLNLVLTTDQSKYFIKFFASFRKPEDCQRYVAIMEHTLDAGVNHPKLYTSPQGHMDRLKGENSELSLCVMDFIDGQSLYEIDQKLTDNEASFLIEQAAKINSIDYKPPFIYDSWAISNFLAEYQKNQQLLEPEDKIIIEPLAMQFKSLNLENLPHSLVHGDIISTNVMKDEKGQLYIIDFSVSNWYPRIQELAVLLCDIFFDPTNPGGFMKKYNWVVAEYQKHISLTPEELKALPLFARVAHAMHIIGATHEKSEGNLEEENRSWLELGRKGLKLSSARLLG